MRIPFPPVGGLTRMPAPFASLGVCLICLLLMSMSMPVLFLIARSISLICLGGQGQSAATRAHMSDLCLAHVYVHARFVFDSALYFFDLPGGQVQSVATTGYSFIFKSQCNCFSSPKGPREAYLLPV